MQKLTVNVQRREKFHLSASVYARARQNYRSHMSLERYGARIGISRSVEDVVRTVAKLTRRVHKYSNTSFAAVPEWRTYRLKITPIRLSKESQRWWISPSLKSMRCRNIAVE